MNAQTALLSAATLICSAVPVFAQNADFNLTYHVERTPKTRLSIETCGKVVVDLAQRAGLRANVQKFPGQLVVIKGGDQGRGAFVVQCIAVENTTVSVVQGIDYQGPKASLGDFADKANAAVKAAAK